MTFREVYHCSQLGSERMTPAISSPWSGPCNLHRAMIVSNVRHSWAEPAQTPGDPAMVPCYEESNDTDRMLPSVWALE